MKELKIKNSLKGQVGTVVAVLADGNAFEVEFSDRQEKTFRQILPIAV